MNTVTAEQFVQQGFAAKIANGECVVIDEQFAESPLVKDITMQHRGGSELYMILYADVTDPNDTVTGRADDTFRITWIKPNPMDKSMQTIGAALGLSGQFKEQYGTAHIEQAVKVIMEDREIITDIRNLCMKAQDERDELARKLMAAMDGKPSPLMLNEEVASSDSALVAAVKQVIALAPDEKPVVPYEVDASTLHESTMWHVKQILAAALQATPQPAPASELVAAVTIEEMSSTLLPDGHEVKGLGCFIEHDGQKLLFFESSVVSDLQHDLSLANDRIAILEQSEQMLLRRIKKLKNKSELDNGFIDHLTSDKEDSQ